jgi:hypothetical protein
LKQSVVPGVDVLPSPLARLGEAIEASRSMLDLPDDWDGEGSPAYDPATWRRAVDFLVEHAVRFWRESGVVIPAPKVRKGPHGTIDLHWRMPGHELLINVPAADEPADYYGDDGADGRRIEGTLDPATYHRWLLQWLTTKPDRGRRSREHPSGAASVAGVITAIGSEHIGQRSAQTESLPLLLGQGPADPDNFVHVLAVTACNDRRGFDAHQVGRPHNLFDLGLIAYDTMMRRHPSLRNNSSIAASIGPKSWSSQCCG